MGLLQTLHTSFRLLYQAVSAMTAITCALCGFHVSPEVVSLLLVHHWCQYGAASAGATGHSAKGLSTSINCGVRDRLATWDTRRRHVRIPYKGDGHFRL
ncbi:hypothetical protein BGW80DRAFT_870389 [Lactifluus volemus]|nr:hypothetical protein BGW80DRAFT_870389 [Lactifluus volemus]